MSTALTKTSCSAARPGNGVTGLPPIDSIWRDAKTLAGNIATMSSARQVAASLVVAGSVRLQVSCKTLLYMPRVDLYVSRKDTKLVLLTIAVLISVAGRSWSHVLNGTTLKIRHLKSSTAGRWRYRYQLISVAN